MKPDVKGSRGRFVEFCLKFGLRVAKSWFDKKPEHLVTYRDPSTREGDELKRPGNDVLDYFLVPERWKNFMNDVYSDMTAGLESNHYPRTLEIFGRLKRHRKPRSEVIKIRDFGGEVARNYNRKFKED